MNHSHLQFLSRGTDYGPEMTGTYDPTLVLLSVVVASAASFAAFQIAERLSTAASRPLRLAWLMAGALAMGCGIWSMHFIGMIAFKLPVPVYYDFPITLLSLLPGVLASAIALQVISRPTITFGRVNLGGALMGVGIGAMHYTGMAAMIMDARMAYDPYIFALSIAVAHVLATASLYVKFHLNEGAPLGALSRQFAGSFIMGCAVAVMHYTGMAATHYFPSHAQGTALSGLSSAVLVLSTSAGAFLILATAIATAAIDRRLKRAALSLHRLIESAPDAIVTVDPSGRIYVVNARMERLFGYDRSELLGMPFESMIRASDSGRFGVRKDGTEFPLEISLSEEPTPAGVFVTNIIRDITARIGLEAQLRASEAKLWEAQKMEALGRLAGGIAHDFNNHLSVIVGLCDMLVLQVPAEGGARRDVEDIKVTAGKSAALTRQLLSFSRSQKSNPKIYDVNELLAREQHALSRMLGAGVRIELVASPGPLAIRVDINQFAQILMNLVINARDAMKGGGVITISAAPDGVDAQITVRDTGPGMERDVLSRIFEPFFTTKSEGTGLGLAIVYGIVTQSHGRIEVDSAPGKGTSFRIRFPPVSGPVEPVNPPAAQAPSAAGSGLILVVEDNAPLRRIIGRGLDAAGYRVLEAEGAAQGTELFDRTSGIDLVVMDVNMPETNGLVLAERLRSKRSGIKILFISGYGLDVMSLPEWPRDAKFLPKPFSMADLIARVRETLTK